MKGIINPKELEISDALLFLWDSYFHVMDYQVIKKNEYYLAQMIQILIASGGGEAPEIEDILMTFDEDKILSTIKKRKQNSRDDALIKFLQTRVKKEGIKNG